MRHKLYHCWDCGQRVIEQNSDNGRLKPADCLQQMRFKLSSGAYMVNPFCEACGNREWTPERLAEFRAAILHIMPSFSKVTIQACEGPVALTAPIQGIAS